jgi:hypothetical protein
MYGSSEPVVPDDFLSCVLFSSIVLGKKNTFFFPYWKNGKREGEWSSETFRLRRMVVQFMLDQRKPEVSFIGLCNKGERGERIRSLRS